MRPADSSTLRCCDTAPKLTSASVRWMSPAERSRSQTSSRICRRRGAARASKTADTGNSLVSAKIIRKWVRKVYAAPPGDGPGPGSGFRVRRDSFPDEVPGLPPLGKAGDVAVGAAQEQDRKSTRLNSSHVAISYAVF